MRQLGDWFVGLAKHSYRRFHAAAVNHMKGRRADTVFEQFEEMRAR
jgi:hypothetical protein